MTDITTKQGTRVQTSEDVEVQDQGAETPRRYRRRSPLPADMVGGNDAVIDALLAGLAQQDVEVQDAFTLRPDLSHRRRRRLPDPDRNISTLIEVPVANTELAALLIETDGVYAWRLPEANPPTEPRRHDSMEAGGHALTFRIDLPPHAAPERRGWVGDLFSDRIFKPVRVVVVKFTARKLVNAARNRLEERVSPGLVQINCNDPQRWIVNASELEISLPQGRPARLLLLVHGTFSSTRGSFGALGLTPWGKAFLEEARQHYDVVLGYDHATLGATPEENARGMLDALEALKLDPATEVDALAFSRGGLVYRVLAERLLPESNWTVKPAKAIFVGCTTSGTPLADPQNWKALLDLYTNLAVAAGKALAFFDPGIASMILTESVKTLGGLIQAVVDATLKDEMMPGLAAMQPKSSLVNELNGPLPHSEGVEIAYYVLGSNFEPKLYNRSGVTASLPRKLMWALLDSGVDRLMGAANDLVVDSQSITQFGERAAQLKATLVWPENAVIHHTNYFEHRDVVEKVGAWLGLDAGKNEMPTIHTRFFQIGADEQIAAVLDRFKGDPDDAVVVIARAGVRRDTPEGMGHYVRVLSSLRAGAVARLGVTVRDALDLHEAQVADEAAEDAPQPNFISATGWVRLRGEMVVGAILPLQARMPEQPEPLPSFPAPSDFHFEKLRTGGDAFLSRSRPARVQISYTDDEPDAFFLDDWADPLSAPLGRRGAAEAAPSSGGTAEAMSESDPEVTCHFGAEMPEVSPLSESAELSVTVSREALDIAPGPTRTTTEATVALWEPIELAVIAKRNCEVISATPNTKVRVPEPGKRETYDFQIKGKTAGPAEVWVDARQGARRLARMVLQPSFSSTGAIAAAAVVSTREADPPSAELRIYENADGHNSPFSLRFVLTSRDLDLSFDYETKRFQMAREPYVASLYKKLEGEWGANGAEFDTFMLSLRAFGADLYRTLVPEEIQEAIWANRDKIGSIEVISHEPFIPWEVLHIVEPGRPVPLAGNKFLAELGLVRWVSNAGFAPARLKIRMGRARSVVPDYADQRLRLPGAKEEVDMLATLFGAETVEASSTTVTKMLAAAGSFDILHFACHGAAEADRIWDASLLMAGRTREDGTVSEDRLDVNKVRQFAEMRHVDGTRPMVFLNACQAGIAGPTLSGTGGMADAFIRCGAGLFVGTLWSVGDRTALTFAQVFYQRLKDGASVTQATRSARDAAKQANEPTWLAYTVYGHPYARLQIEQ